MAKKRSGRANPGGRGSAVHNRVEDARMGRLEREVAVDKNAPETLPDTRHNRYGRPPFISSRERRLRGLSTDDSGATTAFDGIDPDIVAAFAPLYK